MDGVTGRLVAAYPKENGSAIFVMKTLRENFVGQVRPLLLILLGAVGFVLLIACANVANLLMTRAIGRRKKFAVRVALGANRGNILSQLLTERLLLAAMGAALGLAGAQWGVSLLLAAIPEPILHSMPYLRDAGINVPVLGFLCGVTVLRPLFLDLRRD
jgi:putative ABC transport system permease protein